MVLHEDGYKILVFHEIEDPDNDNIDIEVQFDNGERYAATVFTLANIKHLMARYQKTGECNYGQYFWAIDMVIIRRLTYEEIREMVQDLIQQNELKLKFMKVPNLGED